MTQNLTGLERSKHRYEGIYYGFSKIWIILIHEVYHVDNTCLPILSKGLVLTGRGCGT